MKYIFVYFASFKLLAFTTITENNFTSSVFRSIYFFAPHLFLIELNNSHVIVNENDILSLKKNHIQPSILLK